jgi:hypothetical protein
MIHVPIVLLSASAIGSSNEHIRLHLLELDPPIADIAWTERATTSLRLAPVYCSKSRAFVPFSCLASNFSSVGSFSENPVSETGNRRGGQPLSFKQRALKKVASRPGPSSVFPPLAESGAVPRSQFAGTLPPSRSLARNLGRSGTWVFKGRIVLGRKIHYEPAVESVPRPNHLGTGLERRSRTIVMRSRQDRSPQKTLWLMKQPAWYSYDKRDRWLLAGHALVASGSI